MQAAVGVNVSEFSPGREYLRPGQVEVLGQPQAPSTWERDEGFSIFHTGQREYSSTQFGVDFRHSLCIDLHVGHTVRCLSPGTFADGQDRKIDTDSRRIVISRGRCLDLCGSRRLGFAGGHGLIACCAGTVIAARRRDQQCGE